MNKSTKAKMTRYSIVAYDNRTLLFRIYFYRLEAKVSGIFNINFKLLFLVVEEQTKKK